jgi:hypothetical protein
MKFKLVDSSSINFVNIPFFTCTGRPAREEEYTISPEMKRELERKKMEAEIDTMLRRGAQGIGNVTSSSMREEIEGNDEEVDLFSKYKFANRQSKGDTE